MDVRVDDSGDAQRGQEAGNLVVSHREQVSGRRLPALSREQGPGVSGPEQDVRMPEAPSRQPAGSTQYALQYVT